MSDGEGDYFASQRVRELQNEDLALDTTEGLTLFAEGCSLVLFYGNNETSEALAEIWSDLSSQFLDVNFFGINLGQRRFIAERIGQIRNDLNHIYNKFTMAKTPYIIAYRESSNPKISYPQAFYNGIYETEAIANWISDYACIPGYNEYASDTYAQPIEVSKNISVDEDVDESGEFTRPIVTRQINTRKPVMRGPSQSGVERIMASREKELENLELSEEDYQQMTPRREEAFASHRHTVPYRGIGYIDF
jgi:hypothetical protein